MPIKEEYHYIIIRWKGGKMKVDAVSQCPPRRMDIQFVSNRMSFRGHLPTEGLCTYVMLC